MPKTILRYKHLVERGLVKSRAQLANLIKHTGFPPGRLMSPNTRAWTEEEIDKWWSSRPVDGRPLRGFLAKHESRVA